MRFIIPLLFLLFLFRSSYAQENVFENKQLLDSIEVCADHIYNCRFDSARSIIKFLDNQTNNHPINPLLHGLIYYWENFPLSPDNEYAKSFIDSLSRCIEIAEKILDKNSNDIDANLLALTSRMLLMMYYADNGLYFGAFEHVYQSYKLAMKSFDLKNKNNEFYYYTGLFNYYREEYPKAHPIFKPIVYFLRKGNPKKGLEELQFTSQNCVLMDTEANIFLVYIYLFYENNPAKALHYAENLYDNHKNNNIFLSRYIELLLITKNFTKAEIMLDKLKIKSINNEYANMNSSVLQGILEEKYYKNHTKAINHYENGLKRAETFKSYTDSFKTHAYIGLSRIYRLKKNQNLADKYYKKAEEFGNYDYYFD